MSHNSLVNMVNEARQDAITYPSSIFKKMRSKAEKQPVREKGERMREKFKGRTATIKDEDITELCKTYPVKPPQNENSDLTESKGIPSKMELLRREITRKSNKMVKLCEEENKKTASDKFHTNLQQLLNNLK